MFKRSGFGVALGCSALLLASCGKEKDEALPGNGPVAGKGGMQTVNLHVEGMKERLNLT